MRTIATLIATALIVVTTWLASVPTTAAQSGPASFVPGTQMYLPLVLVRSGGLSSTEQPEIAQVLELVNAQRALAACAPVSLNPQLSTAAQNHAQDMAARNFFSHMNPDGQSSGDRATLAGYNWFSLGENIAAGQQSAEEVMLGAYGWMASPGHMANILNCSFTEIGVGHVNQAGSTYDHYWVQVFGTPAN